MEETLTAILISVMAGVLTKFVCNCANILVQHICKWLGRDKKD